MNKVEMVRRLQLLQLLEAYVENSIVDEQHLRELAEKTPSITAAKLYKAAQDIDAAVDAYVDYRDEVIKLIEKLPRAEYLIAHACYVRYKSVEDAAECVPGKDGAPGISYKWAWELKNRAIAHLCEMDTRGLEAANNKVVIILDR